jgi:integrase
MVLTDAHIRNTRSKAKYEVPTFLKSLGAYDGDVRTRLALQLMILTFARTTELRSVQWLEFENLEENDPLWRIPAERTKMKREHVVPLAPQVVTLLNELRLLPGSEARTLSSSPHLRTKDV